MIRLIHGRCMKQNEVLVTIFLKLHLSLNTVCSIISKPYNSMTVLFVEQNASMRTEFVTQYHLLFLACPIIQSRIAISNHRNFSQPVIQNKQNRKSCSETNKANYTTTKTK